MEGTSIWNKANPSSNFNFILSSDLADLGYISPIMVLGLDDSNRNASRTEIIEQIDFSNDKGQLFDKGIPDSEDFFTLSMNGMVLDLGTPNVDESEYNTPMLKNQKMALKGEKQNTLCFI